MLLTAEEILEIVAEAFDKHIQTRVHLFERDDMLKEIERKLTSAEVGGE